MVSNDDVQVRSPFLTALCSILGKRSATSAVGAVFVWSPCHPTVVVLDACQARRGSTNEDLVSKV